MICHSAAHTTTDNGGKRQISMLQKKSHGAITRLVALAQNALERVGPADVKPCPWNNEVCACNQAPSKAEGGPSHFNILRL